MTFGTSWLQCPNLLQNLFNKIRPIACSNFNLVDYIILSIIKIFSQFPPEHVTPMFAIVEMPTEFVPIPHPSVDTLNRLVAMFLLTQTVLGCRHFRLALAGTGIFPDEKIEIQ